MRIVRFTLKGRRELFARLCRDDLNGALDGVRYEPVDDTVVLALLWCAGARWNRGSSPILGDDAAWVRDEEDAPWRVHGPVGAWLENSDRAAWAQLAIGFQVQSTESEGGPELSFFCPFALAGSPWALIAERELLGYPTLLGRFTPANIATGQHTVRVESYLYESGDRSPELRPVLNLTLPARLRGLWDELLPESELASARAVRGVQLRQFRDAVRVNTACHQDLVKIDYLLEKLRTSTPAGSAELRITDSASLRICELLGLDSRIVVAAGQWHVERCELQVSVTPELTGERFSEARSEFSGHSAATAVSQLKKPGHRKRPKGDATAALKPEQTEVPPPAQIAQTGAMPRSQVGVPAVRDLPYPRLAMLKADAQVPPPYAFARMEILGFKLRADGERLEALCHELLNFDRRRGFEYCPATSEIILEVLKYPSMRSTAGELAQFAPDRQYEMLLRVLLGKVEEGAGVATDPRVFCPYILVSNPISMISGREVLGYPKLLGEFAFDGNSETDDLDVDMVTVQTQGYARSQIRGRQRQRERFVVAQTAAAGHHQVRQGAGRRSFLSGLARAAMDVAAQRPRPRGVGSRPVRAQLDEPPHERLRHGAGQADPRHLPSGPV